MALTQKEFDRLMKLHAEKMAAQAQPKATSEKKPGMVSEAFNSGISQTQKGFSQAREANSPLEAVESGVTFGAGAINTALSPLAPLFKPIEKGINFLANKISNRPSVQKFAMSDKGEKATRVAENVTNLSTIAGTGAGLSARPKVPSFPKRTGATSPRPIIEPGQIRNVGKDIIPSSSRVIEHQVSRALDLTPGDLNNIARSTGNDTGRWLADNNLIKENKELTQGAINDFHSTNYKGVRAEIAKVQTTYRPNQVPRYIDSLKQIQNKVKGVPGLEKVDVEVSNLIAKKDNITLNDVQRVKELMDDHFSLYKVTGDVSEGVAKEGLSNLRNELKTFIESEVKQETGADIKQLNNNVSTSKSISEAITTRSQRGLTRSNLKIGDLGVFGIGFSAGGPLLGLAAVFGKKLLESPTVRLRIAKYLDEVSDARKAEMIREMEAGKIPTEFQQFIKKKNQAK